MRNTVTDVRLVSGDLAQAWTEQGREYATVAMRFSMVDVTRDGAGRVVDGSPTERVLVTEVWTFVRARGGHWISVGDPAGAVGPVPLAPALFMSMAEPCLPDARKVHEPSTPFPTPTPSCAASCRPCAPSPWSARRPTGTGPATS